MHISQMCYSPLNPILGLDCDEAPGLPFGFAFREESQLHHTRCDRLGLLCYFFNGDPFPFNSRRLISFSPQKWLIRLPTFQSFEQFVYCVHFILLQKIHFLIITWLFVQMNILIEILLRYQFMRKAIFLGLIFSPLGVDVVPIIFLHI